MNNKNKTKFNIFQFNIMTSLLSVLNKNDVKNSDYIIARYLLENIYLLNNLSIYKVASDCFVSRSSIQRFIKSLGYESFKSLKENVSELYEHQKSFINYTDHAEYTNYLGDQLYNMMKNINKLTESNKLLILSRMIHDAPECVMLSANDGLGSLHTFQQSLLLSNKLVKIISNSSKSIDFISNLSEDDLIITCSVSGNFAIASSDNIRSCKAKKVLITINRTLLFEQVYDNIIYLSEDYLPSSRTINANRNVYTRYGLEYFLDLLYHSYFSIYQEEIIRTSHY